MAFLHLAPSGKFHVGFRYGGRQWKQSLNTSNPQLAERAKRRLEENLRLVEEGRLDIPHGVDVAEFLLYDGKLMFANRPTTERFPDFQCTLHTTGFTESSSKPLLDPHGPTIDIGYSRTIPLRDSNASYSGEPGLIAMPLGEVFNAYVMQLPVGALAEGTLRVAQFHFDHLCEVLGADTPMLAINHERLQAYVNERSKCKGRRGKLLSPTTIKKELGTLSSVWTWAKGKYATGDFPGKKLSYPATSDKSEFQTMAEVERKIALGHLSPEEVEDLWDCVFLTLPEIDELLEHVRRRALHPFLHPMFVFAAHTGARRSEMRRSEIQDIDFNGKRIVLRERKRVHGKHTLRSVPLSKQLEAVLRKWLTKHPGGRYTFCLDASVQKSRKTRAASTPLTCEEAGHHFQQVLLGTKWEKLRGWHAFRHSFCSNCAAKGIPQRMINQWVGHQTEEMVRRYRHMVPSQERAAIKHVFE